MPRRRAGGSGYSSDSHRAELVSKVSRKPSEHGSGVSAVLSCSDSWPTLLLSALPRSRANRLACYLSSRCRFSGSSTTRVRSDYLEPYAGGLASSLSQVALEFGEAHLARVTIVCHTIDRSRQSINHSSPDRRC